MKIARDEQLYYDAEDAYSALKGLESLCFLGEGLAGENKDFGAVTPEQMGQLLKIINERLERLFKSQE